MILTYYGFILFVALAPGVLAHPLVCRDARAFTPCVPVRTIRRPVCGDALAAPR